MVCLNPTTDLWPLIGGSLRASGMTLQYKPPGTQNLQQLNMETADDKRVASTWLAAMHKAAKLLYESKDQWNDVIKHSAGHNEAWTEQEEGEDITKPSIVLFSLTCTPYMLVCFLFNPSLLLPVKTDQIDFLSVPKGGPSFQTILVQYGHVWYYINAPFNRCFKCSLT